MVFNIRIIERQTADSDDPLGRDWYGYDPDATPQELWENNRGDWDPNGDRVSEEKWAALSYQGRIILVAELHRPNHEILAANSKGQRKKALLGHPLSPGHPVHEALIGSPVKPARRFTYDPDPEIPEPADSANSDLSEVLDEPGARGQGLQMDAAVRKEIENAAQDRLMSVYRDEGWTVTDTRQNRPYDAVAVKGAEKIYLEAKGTQSQGNSVIVTRNEVDHARQHPGQCRMGVWSGMRLVNGEVDLEAGEFGIIDFDPEDKDLRPRDFDWTVPSTPT
ncbi:protein NO VEIN domain-containing protein [Sinomonas soli]